MPRSGDDFDVVVARLAASEEELRRLGACLSAAERERAARFLFDRHRRRFIVARARLRELLGARLGRPAGEVPLVYAGSGKPCLADDSLRFSVSHCGDVALFAFSKACEIGVDIEEMRPIAAADSIAAQLFSARERLAYGAARDKVRAFLRHWTRKEALAKGIGGGLSLPPEKLDPAAAPGWRVHSFFPLPGFIAAVASHSA